MASSMMKFFIQLLVIITLDRRMCAFCSVFRILFFLTNREFQALVCASKKLNHICCIQCQAFFKVHLPLKLSCYIISLVLLRKRTYSVVLSQSNGNFIILPNEFFILRHLIISFKPLPLLNIKLLQYASNFDSR